MNSFQMKNKLASVLGDEHAEELVAYIDERTGREYGEERASINATLQEIIRRLDRIESRIERVESRMDSLQIQQVNLIRWMIGVGLTVVGLTVTLVKLL